MRTIRIYILSSTFVFIILILCGKSIKSDSQLRNIASAFIHNMESPVSETVILQEQVFNNERKFLWVFAYGSLCWRPGFQFHKAVIGHIQGFSRKFWQGNTTHRGTEDKPGRVATLVEDHKELVYGIAFALNNEAAIPYLSKRECELGGYTSHFTNFYPKKGDPFKVLIYIATPKNPLWLGDADITDIANQVIKCSGSSGHNIEYVIRLANFMRNLFPNYHDQHLYNLEIEILNRIKEMKMCLTTLMGSGEGCVDFIKQERNSINNHIQEQERIETFQHITRVPEKTLRCLNL